MISPRNSGCLFNFFLRICRMSRVFVCFGGEWKEIEKEYATGQMKGLNVDANINLRSF